MVSLAERLGRPADARLLIVTSDDLGSSHAANVGVYEALREGIATSASLMVPCPWAREAASRYRGEDVGRPPHPQRRARPVPVGPDHPRPVAARRRRRLPPHRGRPVGPRRPRRGPARAAGPGRAGHPVGLRRQPPRQPPGRAAAQARVLRRLPRPGRRLRAAGPAARAPTASAASASRSARWPPRRACSSPTTSSGVSAVGSRRAIERRSRTCRPGVTEIHVHPAVDTPELRALTPDWPARVDDHDLVVNDHSLAALLDRVGAELIGYRALRDLQRAGG